MANFVEAAFSARAYPHAHARAAQLQVRILFLGRFYTLFSFFGLSYCLLPLQEIPTWATTLDEKFTEVTYCDLQTNEY